MYATSLLAASLMPAQSSKPALDPATVKKASAAADKAVSYLRSVQRDNGAFADGDTSLPITSLVLAGLLRSQKVAVADPMIAKGLALIEKSVRSDGGIYPEGSTQKNYCTAITLMALVPANKDQRYTATINKAVEFLKAEQWDESENITPQSPKWGGAGYGRKSRPDLSNIAFLLEALDAAGLPKHDRAYKRAIVFISRCQNFSGEGGNDQPQAKLIDDGGFYYTPAEDSNPAGGSMATGLRSYGSMTYAGLKSFLYAGVKKDDPRMQAAVGWIQKHYTLEENPGMDLQGLYYYYHTFSKALGLLGQETIVDEKGVSHSWRNELLTAIVKRQKPDGSWANENSRWLESNPELVTGYMLLAYGNVVNTPGK